jgi:hypothetical protein
MDESAVADTSNRGIMAVFNAGEQLEPRGGPDSTFATTDSPCSMAWMQQRWWKTDLFPRGCPMVDSSTGVLTPTRASGFLLHIWSRAMQILAAILTYWRTINFPAGKDHKETSSWSFKQPINFQAAVMYAEPGFG